MTPYEKLKKLREKISNKGGAIDKQHIINNLKEVYDPEMSGVSVYELGLIYDIDIDDKEGHTAPYRGKWYLRVGSPTICLITSCMAFTESFFNGIL